jgi:hypothetical protein
VTLLTRFEVFITVDQAVHFLDFSSSDGRRKSASSIIVSLYKRFVQMVSNVSTTILGTLQCPS